jgi:translation elongation factor EF-1alpha
MLSTRSSTYTGRTISFGFGAVIVAAAEFSVITEPGMFRKFNKNSTHGTAATLKISPESSDN